MGKERALYVMSAGFFALFLYNYCLDIWPVVHALETTDFPNYYMAGKRLWAGQAIYTPIRAELIEHYGFSDYKAYTADTPLAVLVLSPLSFFTMPAGAEILNIISIFLFVFSCLLLNSHFSLSRPVSFLLTSVCLSSLPFLFLLKRAHMESILLLTIGLGLIFCMQGKSKRAGILWGISAALKLFPLLLLLPYLFRREKRDLAIVGFLSFFVLTALSVVIVGLNDSRYFLLEVIPQSKVWYGAVANYSLISFFTALSGTETVLLYSAVPVSIILFHCFYVIFKERPGDSRTFILTLSAALLVSPLSWLNYLILLVPCFSMLCKLVQRGKLQRAALAPLFLIFWRWPDYVQTPWHSLTVILSFAPMFGLLSLQFLYQRKVGNLPPPEI